MPAPIPPRHRNGPGLLTAMGETAMSEEVVVESTPESATEPDVTVEIGDAGKKAIDAHKAKEYAAKAEAAEARKEAEAFRKELAKLQDRDLSELQRAQKAAADADARVKEVTSKAAARIATATFKSLAAVRNPDADVKSVLDYVDLGRFVDDDGEVDEKAMQAAVNRLIAEPSGAAPGFDGGARTPPPKGADMNQIIRAAAGH